MPRTKKVPSSSGAGSQDDGAGDYGKQPIKPSYVSEHVAIPDDFLSVTSPPPDARPITISPIDFSKTVLPEYEGCYAVVLDNILSPGECRQLLRMAEASVPDSERFVRSRPGAKAAAAAKDPWRPALVHVGGGWEVRDKTYRSGDRIIWDQQEVVDRLWARLAQAPGLGAALAEVPIDSRVQPAASKRFPNARWDFFRVNRRMRFLKYQPGGFFKPHCDSAYISQEEGKPMQTWYTLHLYINDSKAEAGGDAELEGGATCFLSSDNRRKFDVDPKAGRVLIFQHHRLNHSGDDVRAGTKYTMRTDIEYQMDDSEDE